MKDNMIRVKLKKYIKTSSNSELLTFLIFITNLKLEKNIKKNKKMRIMVDSK